MNSLISFVGYGNSGKSTLAKELATRSGFKVIGGSEILRAAHAALPEDERPPLITRADYLSFNNSWRRRAGIDAMARCVLDFQQANPGPVCFEAVRNFSDARTLQSNGSLIVALSCTFEERYQRALLAKKERDELDPEKFRAAELSEADSPDPCGLHIEKVFQIADLSISTSQPVEKVIRDLRASLKTWGIIL